MKSLFAICCILFSSLAFANAGVVYRLTQDHDFLVVHNNVPTSLRPEAKKDGETVTIPTGAVIYVMGKPFNDLRIGLIVDVGLEIPDQESEVPMDMYIRMTDLKAATAEVLDASTLDAADPSVTPEEAKELDEQESAANRYYYTARADSSDGSIGHAGSGGRHRVGTTYALEKVEIQARKMGICQYKPSLGYARKSIAGFIEECKMQRVSYDPTLPPGSICIGKGDFEHMCDGRRCGTAMIKLESSIWLGETLSGRPAENDVCLAPIRN